MDQKAVIITFFAILVIGIVAFAFNSVRQVAQPLNSPSPSPSPELKMTLALPTDSAQPFGVNVQGGEANPNAPIKRNYTQFPGTYRLEDLQDAEGKPTKGAVIQTDKGEIAFVLFPEAIKATSNFIFLTINRYYDGLTFHRVEPWVVQGGDPTGTGTGGPGYKFEDEPVTRQYAKGIVAMANAGPNTNGSQFFILTQDTPLPPNYTIFGQVVKGQEVVDKISVGDVMKSVKIVNVTE